MAVPMGTRMRRTVRKCSPPEGNATAWQDVNFSEAGSYKSEFPGRVHQQFGLELVQRFQSDRGANRRRDCRHFHTGVRTIILTLTKPITSRSPPEFTACRSSA